VTCITASFFTRDYSLTMKAGFNIFRKLENGQALFVSWRADLKQAERLVSDLNELWPAEYEIRGELGELYGFTTAN
jgi:hypothetical protein